MRKITFVFSTLLRLCTVFLLAFIWAKYFFKTFYLAILISLAILSAFELLRYFYLRKKRLFTDLKQQEKDDAENIFLSMSLSKSPEGELLKILTEKYDKIKKTKNAIIVEDEKNIAFCPHFVFSPIQIDEIIFKVKQFSNCNKIVILCYKYTAETLAFCKNLDKEILLLDVFETYQKVYKYLNSFPKITHTYKKEKAKTFKDFVEISLNRKRSKYYFLSALYLVISSVFLPHALYYCIFSSILLTLALFSYFNKKYNKLSPYEIFE